MIGNIALYVALRLVALILPLVPLRLAYVLASAAGQVAYILFPIPRRQLAHNLSIVLGLPAGSPEVRRASRSVFVNDARNWVDTLRIGRVELADIERSVDIEDGGWGHLVAAYEAGKGVILVTLHLGNYDLVGQLVALRGFTLTVPVEHMRPSALYDFITHERRSQGINAVPVEQAPRALLRGLRNREVVGIAGDKTVAGRRIDVKMFGRTAYLPRGPVSLARRSGAPLLVACGVRAGDGYSGIITPPVPMQITGSAEDDDHINAQTVANVFEVIIERYPDHWMMFDNLWSDGAQPAATIVQTEEAAV